jgi:hypothetical protein
MPRESAAKAVAEIVKKSGKSIGKSKRHTWESLLSIRAKFEEGSCPEEAWREYRVLKDGLTADLIRLPLGSSRRDVLLENLRGHLDRYC